MYRKVNQLFLHAILRIKIKNKKLQPQNFEA